MGAAHPAQPHVADPTSFFEKPERLAAFIEVAKQFEGANVIVEDCNVLADTQTLMLVPPASFLEEFATTSHIPESTIQEFGREFYVDNRSYDAARAAVGCAIEGVNRIIQGQTAHVICGCRPPGHHARPAQSMGFCGLSTAAIAAIYGQRLGRRVCIFDYDVHSGNGTIEAVVSHSDILFAEIRTMTMDAFDSEVPYRAYPYPSGCSLDPHYWYEYHPPGPNLILEDMYLGATGEEYLSRFTHKILPKIQEFNPNLIIISAGFDCMKGDPLGDLGLERHHIATLVGLLVKNGTPTLTVLEGGYDLHNVKEGLTGHIEGLLSAT